MDKLNTQSFCIEENYFEEDREANWLYKDKLSEKKIIEQIVGSTFFNSQRPSETLENCFHFVQPEINCNLNQQEIPDNNINFFERNEEERSSSDAEEEIIDKKMAGEGNDNNSEEETISERLEELLGNNDEEQLRKRRDNMASIIKVAYQNSILFIINKKIKEEYGRQMFKLRKLDSKKITSKVGKEYMKNVLDMKLSNYFKQKITTKFTTISLNSNEIIINKIMEKDNLSNLLSMSYEEAYKKLFINEGHYQNYIKHKDKKYERLIKNFAKNDFIDYFKN